MEVSKDWYKIIENNKGRSIGEHPLNSFGCEETNHYILYNSGNVFKVALKFDILEFVSVLVVDLLLDKEYSFTVNKEELELLNTLME